MSKTSYNPKSRTGGKLNMPTGYSPQPWTRNTNLDSPNGNRAAASVAMQAGQASAQPNPEKSVTQRSKQVVSTNTLPQRPI